MKKNAFTLVELAVVMVFIGFVSIITMNTINNRFSDYNNRYYIAYDSLSKTAYNIYADTYCMDGDSGFEGCTLPAECREPTYDPNKDYSKTGRPFPKTPQCLCARFKEYFNTSTDVNCKEGYIASKDNIDEFNNQFYDKDNKPTDKLKISLSNSFNFFFSKTLKLEDSHIAGIDDSYYYFIVYVDLNGSAKPNRAGYHPSFKSNDTQKHNPNLARPDIVPFAITSKGDVIPIGFPIHDKSYVTARVVNSDNYESQSFTIDEARRLAFANVPTDPKAYTDIPLSLIPYLEKALPGCIKPGKEETSNYYIGSVDLGNGNITFNCDAGTYNCVVKIDENLDKRF